MAELCALNLLHAAKPGHLPNIQAIGFASPAINIGNQALASFLQQRGWKRFLTSYLLPGELLLALPLCPPSQQALAPPFLNLKLTDAPYFEISA